MNQERAVLEKLFDTVANDWQEVEAELDSASLPAFDTTKNAVVVLNRILQGSAQEAEEYLNSELETDGNVDETFIPTADEEYLQKYATAIGCGYLLQAISAKYKAENID